MRQYPAFLLVATALTFAAATVGSRVAAQDPPADAPAQPDEPRAKVEMNELEKKFEKTMTGATLVGYFTTEGQDEQPPVEERYFISKVTKIGPDQWLFVARIGDAQIPVPLPVPVKWAGDTPVITLTDLTIPGLGTYTARVMIFRDHYAGYWSGGKAGGNLWGRVERTGEQGAPKAPDAPAAPEAPDAPAEPAK